MRRRAECSCALAAAVRRLSVDGAIGAALEPAHGRPVAKRKGRPVGATKRHRMGVPRTLNIAQMVRLYVDHQIEIVVRRTQYLLREAQERAHIVSALVKARLAP